MEAKSVAPGETATQEPMSEPEVVKKRSRKRSITIFIVVSVINASLLVLLWTQLLTPAHQTQTSGNSTTSTSSGDINSPLVGKPAPDFTLSVLNSDGSAGGKVHLADFKGKAVILNFWASWCEPCNQEAPFLQKSWPRLQAQNVAFIGVDGPEKASDAQQFLKHYAITYRNVQDTVEGATAIDYGVTGFPETVFINKQGIVVAKWVFPLTEQGLQLEMNKLTR